MTEKVRYERVGAAAVLTIDRPERRDAVDGDTADGLATGLARFEADNEARVLVLTGAGTEAFCAGADLKAIETLAHRSRAPLGISYTIPSKPTIAAISGWCLAGGLELALWCDLRVATEDARLGFTERRFGVPLIDGGTQRLPRVVGLGRAMDLVLTGRVIDAEEALRIGLVTEVVPAGIHLDRALAIAEGLAAFPQPTMLSDRRAMLEGLGLPLEEGFEVETRLGYEVVPTAIEGAQRFAAGEGRGATGAGV